MNNSFSIVIPVYNEEDNIVILINEILSLTLNNFELIIVDDASTDSTFNVLNDFKKTETIKILKHNKNLGQSHAINTGIKHSKYDNIVTIDGDGQNNPKDIAKILQIYFANPKIKLVGGIRKKRQDTYIKKISSKIANNLRKSILKDECDDTGCSLKVFSKKIFLSFKFFDGIHRFLPAYFKGYGYSTKFIYVDHRKRKFGNSKYNTANRLFKGIKDLYMVYNHLNKIND